MNTDLALIRYFLRCNLFDRAFDVASDSFKQSPSRGDLLFWKSCCQGLCGEHQECIRELEMMRKHHRFLDYAIISALIYFHQEVGAHQYRREHMMKLKVAEKAALECIHVDGALLAAEFHLFVGKNAAAVEKAKSCMNKGTRAAIGTRSAGLPETVQMQQYRLELWVCVMTGGPRQQKGDRFDSDEHNSTTLDIDSLMAKAKYHESLQDFNISVDIFNAIIRDHPKFFPALTERAKLYLLQKKFKLAEDSAREGFLLGNDVESLRILAQILFLTKRNEPESQCTEYLIQLISMLDSRVDMKLEVSKLFFRLGGNDTEVHGITTKLASEVCNEELDHWEGRIELARQLRRLGRYDESLSQFEIASTLDLEKGNTSLQGMILCQVLSGASEEAEQQIEFLDLVQEEDCSEHTPDITFAKLLLQDGRKKADNAHAIGLISDLVRHFTKSAKNPSFSYTKFDLDTAVDVIMCFTRIYQYHQNETISNDDANENQKLAGCVCNLLNLIMELYPCEDRALVLFAKIQYENKAYTRAKEIIQSKGHVIRHSALLNVINAQILWSMNDISGCRQSLEHALGQKFAIREDPLYNLLKGSLHVLDGAYQDAKESLYFALAHMETTDIPRLSLVSPQDKFQCFRKLVEVLRNLHLEQELEDLQRLAEEAFSDEEDFRFLTFKSELYLDCGEVQKAIDLFDRVGTESKQYNAAQMAKAEVCLNHLQDRKGYIQCHQSILSMNETPQTYLKLGDAFMKINEISDAIATFFRALELDPRNENLAIRIGDTLIRNHEYLQALEHYKRYLEISPETSSVLTRIASLYIDMQKFDDALPILQKAWVVEESNVSSTASSHQNFIVKKIAHAHIHLGNYDEAIIALIDIKILNREDYTRDINLSAFNVLRENVDALSLLLTTGPGSKSLLIQMEIYHQVQVVQHLHDHRHISLNDNLIQQYCEYLVKQYPESQDAFLLLFDMSVHHCRIDEALSMCTEFIANHSTDYKVISKYITLLSKVGKLDEVTEISRQIECTNDPKADTRGRAMCQGLCKRILGDKIEALKYFNFARQCKEWSESASINMIELYLRLDNFEFWCSNKGSLELDGGSLNSVSKLIKQINMRTRKAKVLRGYLETIKALKSGDFSTPTKIFSSLLDEHEDDVSALLGLAQVYALSSTQTKVRNALKKIVKTPHRYDFIIEFERSYLMLAIDYIERKKVDLAHDLCKRCLFYNKSCSKAWELLGLTFELKDGNNETSIIECYEKSWSFGQHRSCHVGYRLTALYLKIKRPIEAMKVALKCQSIFRDDDKIKSLLSSSKQ